MIAAVIATILGLSLLILCSYAVYKQKLIRQNGHLTNGTGKTINEIGITQRNSNRKINGSHEHSDIVDIPEENCPSLEKISFRKINLYDISKNTDQFDYLKDVPRCRCYSV